MQDIHMVLTFCVVFLAKTSQSKAESKQFLETNANMLCRKISCYLRQIYDESTVHMQNRNLTSNLNLLNADMLLCY